MNAELLISVHTMRYRYVALRDHIVGLRVMLQPSDLIDADGQLIPSCELGRLLDPHDLRSNPRRHALLVPTRRRLVALLVERVDDMVAFHTAAIHPLPPILAQQLQYKWVSGVVNDADQPILLLDLRQIAQDGLRSGVFH